MTEVLWQGPQLATGIGMRKKSFFVFDVPGTWVCLLLHMTHLILTAVGLIVIRSVILTVASLGEHLARPEG